MKRISFLIENETLVLQITNKTLLKLSPPKLSKDLMAFHYSYYHMIIYRSYHGCFIYNVVDSFYCSETDNVHKRYFL